MEDALERPRTAAASATARQPAELLRTPDLEPFAGRQLSPRGRRWLIPLGIFAASRAALWVVLIFALKLPGAGGTNRFLDYWDSAWYVQIAKTGYPRTLVPAPGQSDHAFFPLYPIGIKILHTVIGSWNVSSLLITLVASGLAMVAIYHLVERLTDEGTALRSVALTCFFPWAFIFSMGYAEGLMMLFAAVCLLALLDDHWLLAGVAALLAGAVRPNGFVLFFPCAWAAYLAIRRTRSWTPLVAPVLAPLGILGFFFYLQRRTGDFFADLTARQRGWGGHNIQFSASQLPHVVATYLAHPLNDLNRTASLAILVLLVISVVLMVRWRPPAILWLYSLPIIALALYYDTYASMPRFYLTAFPLLVAIARPLKDVPFWITVAVSSMLMVGIFLLIGTTTWMLP
ncbi:MAG TPA: glycosyltransferase family 39 protein [Actinomycetota bacterium]|nr:glycosyltransferase family 39 protein [Actinomycetota bacterium]